MKPYLVDVPVKVSIWIRPECQRKQFEIIKQARPSILFLISDGGRNEKEWEAIYQNREMYESEIDWECTVYKKYETENRGMYARRKEVQDFIWTKVDRCIYLEDDIIPSVSYFRYCAELLERYKDDKRVNVICGMNHLGIYNDVNSDYFFSRQGSIWGCALWRRTIEQYNDFEYGKDTYIMKQLKHNIGKNKIFWNRVKTYAQQELCEGHIAGGEFYFEFSMYGQNQLQIIPKKNMINNIGCTSNSTHSLEYKQLPRGLQKVFNMQTYELDFPMKHAGYIIPDFKYEKKRNRIMAYNHSFINFCRRIECTLRKVYFGNFRSVKNSIRRQIKRSEFIEK